MLKHRFCNNEYSQIVGGIDEISKLPSKSYGVIICHNVLEYLDNRAELHCEFSRVLKLDGFVSIIKHNKAGKIMQKAVFEYKNQRGIRID